MSRIQLVRTTAFRLKDEHFGSVYVYRPGEAFTRVWNSLEQTWRARGDTSESARLPYRGLATALRVLTGDFVALERNAGGSRAFIISRKPVEADDLLTCVRSWEIRALGLDDGPVSRVLDDLRREEVRVADHVARRDKLCPNLTEGWVWDVGVWEAAHRLSATSMRTDSTVLRWRLDSDAALLSWADVVEVGRAASAMHKLTLHLITIPGVSDPVLSVQASLVRLAPTWAATGGARYAWADLNETSPLLRASVRTRRDVSGALATDWSDRAADVLNGASLDPLPRIAGVDPAPLGVVRTGYAKQPRTHRIGRGVGQWFHEYVAHHARATLGEEVSPVTLSTRRVPLGWKQGSARLPMGFERSDGDAELRLLVIYSDAAQRRRVRDALAEVIADEAPERSEKAFIEALERLRALEDGVAFCIGPVEMCFLRPEGADEYLVTRRGRTAIEGWADAWLPDTPSGRWAAIIETNEDASDDPRKKDGLADPKQVLRRHLAKRGVATQFISASSAPRPLRIEQDTPKFREHAAANALGDLFRSAGFFLRPFPEFGGGDGTIVVGVYGVRLTPRSTGAGTSYLVNLVAVSLGTREAWGYADGEGWLPLHQATSRFLAKDQHENSENAARTLAERAIGALYGRFGERAVVLLFDAVGCRRFWPCLTDKSVGAPESWMRSHGKAVVRVRTATSELLRPAGVGLWEDGVQPAQYTGFRLMSVTDGEGRAPTCVLSGSAVMNREISARKSTRFAAPERDLRRDWHSLGLTELQILDAGRWAEEDLLRQVGILCRVAPTWDRTLRWPSPLHLARAIVRDHPHRYFESGEDDEDVEDGKQLRFDWSIW